MFKFLKEVFGSELHATMAIALVAAATVPALAGSLQLMLDPVQDYGGVFAHAKKPGNVLGESTTTPLIAQIPLQGEDCQPVGTTGKAQVCVKYELGKYIADKDSWGMKVAYELKGVRIGSVYFDDQALSKRVARGGKTEVKDGIGAGETHNLIFYSQANGKGTAIVTLPVTAPDSPPFGSEQLDPSAQITDNILRQQNQKGQGKPADCNFPEAPKGFHYEKGPEGFCAVMMVKDGTVLPQFKGEGERGQQEGKPMMQPRPQGGQQQSFEERRGQQQPGQPPVQ